MCLPYIGSIDLDDKGEYLNPVKHLFCLIIPLTVMVSGKKGSAVLLCCRK